MPTRETIRVLIAKPGLDGHDKGAKIVARGLRDAGMEVIYTGIRQTVSSIVRTAVQESADVVGLSILSGTHLSVCRDLIEALTRAGARDKVVLVGGIIPRRDVSRLKQMGIAEVFGPEATIDEIIRCVEDGVKALKGPRR